MRESPRFLLALLHRAYVLAAELWRARSSSSVVPRVRNHRWETGLKCFPFDTLKRVQVQPETAAFGFSEEMGATAAHGTKTGPPPPALALALALARVLPPPPALALALARVLQHADTAVHSTARSSVNHALRAALGQVPRSVLGTHPAPGAFAPRWEARGRGGGDHRRWLSRALRGNPQREPADSGEQSDEGSTGERRVQLSPEG